ncbi:MAG: MBL fold metallo-hydrolase [Lachnospiraceae bacterium]|nr:MBL fold metallo-hydrolase [Lachnospiraceae bacterium]
MEIIKINETTWRIEDSGVRFFLLAGEKKALLIDSGMQVHNAKEIAQGLVNLPIELLNTHGDIDHVGSNDEFESFYMNPAEASNYYNTQKKTGTIIPVTDGDIIDLGDRELEIITLPGHTPGSIAVLDKNNRVLISGDPIQDGNIFMFGVQREMHAYLLSLEKLKKYLDKFDTIYPSHGSFPVTPEIIDSLHEGATRILAGEVEGSDAEFHGIKIKRYDVGVAGFLCDYK